jgi:signal transduction histidine kinase
MNTRLDEPRDARASTLSHDLRTPLTLIRAFAEIVHDNPGLELAERTRFLGIVMKEAERLTRLINDIFDVSRLESGAAECEAEKHACHVADGRLCMPEGSRSAVTRRLAIAKGHLESILQALQIHDVHGAGVEMTSEGDVHARGRSRSDGNQGR